jgi:hypothetical protein
MRKKTTVIILLIMLTLILGSQRSGEVLASEDKTELISQEGQRGLYLLSGIGLMESVDGITNWTSVHSTTPYDFAMVIDPLNPSEYLDVESVMADPTIADGDHAFYLDTARVPDNFLSYWAGKGVVEGASAPLSYMWQIINGDAPILYLRVAGSSFDLIDGYQYLVDGSTTTEKFRVNGDLPVFTYNFGGTLNYVGGSTDYQVLGITFTHEVNPSLRISGMEPEEIVIDGCGYVDVTIHLENVVNLYAVDLSLSFDPNFVEVVDLLVGEDGVNLQPIEPWNDPDRAYTVRNIAYNIDDPGTTENEAGTIRFISSLYNSESPITGDLDVAVIRLRAKALGTSALTITGMELSDRDGYLVGVPLDVAIPYTVTTQFTTAGGLDLGIERLENGVDVQLSWPEQNTELVSSYILYRSQIPYFAPDSSTVIQTITNTGQNPVVYTDNNVLGDLLTNPYFYNYRLEIQCSSGLKSPPSWWVGKIEYELWETTTTDFNWVGLVLDIDLDWTDTRALVEHINTNSYSSDGYTVSAKAVSKWLPIGQNVQTYNTTIPITNFSVFLRTAYRIVIDIAPNELVEHASIIWAQVGRLPVIESDTYKLYETALPTSYNWILQPLDKVTIEKASELASDVVNNSNGEVSVGSVSWWGESSQGYQTFSTSIPLFNNFSTKFGYPYRLSIFGLDSDFVTYP